MKQKLSAILFLVSLLTGLMQPVLPMVEYFVFQENIIEFLCENRDQPEMNCQGMCYLQTQLEKQQETSNDPLYLINLDEIPVLTITQKYLPTFISPPQGDINHEWANRYSYKFSSDFFEPPRS